MSAFVITSRLALAIATAAAASACSGESPVAPTSAVVAAAAEHNARPGQGVPGTYELTFTTYRINTLIEVSSLVVSSEELTLKAYVTDSAGQPATAGSVTFEYCSYKGGPANDISRPDEAPLEACAEGTASWARLESISVTEGRCPRLGLGYACFRFGIVRIPREVGFRMRYDPRNSGIASGGTLPKNFLWVAGS
jgi:hypothetical protein